MAKLKINSKYSVIPNSLVNSDKISFKAKGLYAYIQSKPDGWDFSAERISMQVKEGLPSVRSALKELELNGYLKRVKYQNQFGHWEIEYFLFEDPTLQNPTTENLYIGNPTSENPYNGNSTNINNIDLSKQDNNTIYINNKKINKKPIDYMYLMNDFNFTHKRIRTIFEWIKYKEEKKEKYTELGFVKFLNQFEKFSDDEFQEMVNVSMANSWKGLFEIKNNSKFAKKPELGPNAQRALIMHNLKTNPDKYFNNDTINQK